jgi:hypothetical protein
MPAADLLDAYAAIDWAVNQQPKLAKRITDWAGSYSTRIAVEGGRKAYYVTANPVPAIINAETGSIINSIRTSLDLLASALAARNGYASSRHTYFPVCKSLADFPEYQVRRFGEDQEAIRGRPSHHREPQALSGR